MYFECIGLVSFWCGFALVLWCWWLPYLGNNKPSWRLTLCMTRVNPWVCGWGHCLLGQKTTCKRGITWRIIPCCPWRGYVNPWGCGWGLAWPIDHMLKEVHIMLVCLGSNLFVAVWCLGDISILAASWVRFSNFEMVLDIFITHNEWNVVS